MIPEAGVTTTSSHRTRPPEFEVRPWNVKRPTRFKTPRRGCQRTAGASGFNSHGPSRALEPRPGSTPGRPLVVSTTTVSWAVRADTSSEEGSTVHDPVARWIRQSRSRALPYRICRGQCGVGGTSRRTPSLSSRARGLRLVRSPRRKRRSSSTVSLGSRFPTTRTLKAPPATSVKAR